MSPFWSHRFIKLSPPSLTETEQGFCSFPFTKPCSVSCRRKRVCPPAIHAFYPPAVPSGITHYTFVPKVVCQRELPPLWKPRWICLKWVLTQVFHVATFPPNPNNKQELCSVQIVHSSVYCHQPVSRSACSSL